MFRLIGFGIRVWGCLYLAYWLLFFGIVGVLIITSYLREHKHHPAVKTAARDATASPQMISADSIPRPY